MGNPKPAPVAQISADPEYRSAAQVRKRYGNISGMSLWRWLADPQTNFPPPDQIIAGRRYWLGFDARRI